ncbi:MAG TPA: SMP-30/gluconolactonase/LRE family protein [Myxococcota bacterium]|nr:SMP-30/gluconolactonase/LRE family protein [Myxococcota bacterium]
MRLLRSLAAVFVVLLALAGVVVGVLVASTPSPIAARALAMGPAPRLDELPRVEGWSASCVVSGRDDLVGPEDLERDPWGRLYTGLHDGRIVRLLPQRDGSLRSETVARAAGRPNGVTADPDGSLLVSYDYGEPGKRIDRDGRVHALDWLTGADAAIGRDGTLYHPHLAPWKRTGTVGVDFGLVLLEAAHDGELRATHPATGRSVTLATGLFLPDGVALSENEDFVLVGEFGAARITRVWLRGPQAGRQEPLIENLPGLPDGLASDGRGTFFVALPVLRSALLDWLQARPRLKELAARLAVRIGPRLMTGVPAPGAKGTSAVLAFDESGRIMRVYVDATGVVGPMITTVVPAGPHLYVSSLMGFGVARCAREPAGGP